MIKLLILQQFLLVVYLLIESDQSELECNCRLGGIKKRIIGGHFAPNNYVPWMAAIFYTGEFMCGAFIINKNTVVSAAHCLKNFNSSLFKVVVGVNSLKNIDSKYIYQVNDLIIHPKYDSSDEFHGHDIGFLKISKSIIFEKGKIEVGCISFQNSSIFNRLMISGFGSTCPIYVKNGLRTSFNVSTELKYVFYKELSKIYYSGKAIIVAQNLDKNSSTCSGDSGSAVHYSINGKSAIVGLNSFGIDRTKFDKNNQEIRESCIGNGGFCRLSIDFFFQITLGFTMIIGAQLVE